MHAINHPCKPDSTKSATSPALSVPMLMRIILQLDNIYGNRLMMVDKNMFGNDITLTKNRSMRYSGIHKQVLQENN